MGIIITLVRCKSNEKGKKNTIDLSL